MEHRRPSVFLADEQALLCDLARLLLERDFEVVGMATNGKAMLAAVESIRPEVLIVDVAMPTLSGLDAARRLRVSSPATKVLFLTDNSDVLVALEAMRVGASGYILKSAMARELLTAIRAALAGESWVAPSIQEQLSNVVVAAPRGRLTPREREVVQLIAEGKQMKEAAAVLNVSTRTVAFHKYRAMEKLGMRSTADLVRFAITEQLLPLPSAAIGG